MPAHPEFISGYDAANKAKQLIINSQLVELERLRAALKKIADQDGAWHGAEDAYRYINIAKAALKE